MFKKRKEKKNLHDISTIKYWQERLKPGMKINNHELCGKIPYANFIVPNKFQIVNNYGTINLSFRDIQGVSSWYHLYKDGISAKIIQKDFMSPTTNPCAEINLPF